MDFWQVIEERHSVRNFDGERDVPPEVVQRILQAAIRAPSAGNCQPWHFVVIRSKQSKNLPNRPPPPLPPKLGGLRGEWLDEEAASKALNLPANLRPVAIVPIGYPAARPSRT